MKSDEIQPAQEGKLANQAKIENPRPLNASTQPTIQPNSKKSIQGSQFNTPIPIEPILQTPVLDDLHQRAPIQNASSWERVFTIVGVLQVAGIALFGLVYLWSENQPEASINELTSLTFFLAIIFYVTPVFLSLLAIANLISLPFFLFRNRVKGSRLLTLIISLVISGLILFVVSGYLQQRSTTLNETSEKLDQFEEEREQQFRIDNSDPEISKQEAIALLNRCEIKYFYYTDQVHREESGRWGELSSTGIVLTKKDGQPVWLSIADRHINELVPLARSAKKSCGSLLIWHDGSFEKS